MSGYSEACVVHGPASEILKNALRIDNHIRDTTKWKQDTVIAKYAGNCSKCNTILMTTDNGACPICESNKEEVVNNG